MVLNRDPREQAEVIYAVRTRRLARPLTDYALVTAIALLTEHDAAADAFRELEVEESVDHWSDTAEVEITGDPLFDKWSRELDSGLMPNLDEKG